MIVRPFPKFRHRMIGVSYAVILVALSIAAATNAAVAKSSESPDPDSQVSRATESDGENFADHVTIDKVASDEMIELRLEGILRATEWYTQVDVEVRDSVAFLNGVTDTDDRKQWASKLARNVEGVAVVVNRMQVEDTIDLSETLSIIWASVSALWDDFLAHSPLILAGVLALIVTAVLDQILHATVANVIRRTKLGSSMQDLVLQLLTIGVWCAGLLVSAVIVFPGMTPARALTVLGLGSVAVGFAFKDIFENFFAGILILWKYPFDKGDFIECGEIQGRIENIAIRMSMIRQVDGQLVVVPNSLLFKNPVDVLTNRRSRRTTIICGVAYATDLNEARTRIEQAVEDCPTVHKDHDIDVFAREFADSSINFEVTWWTGATPADTRRSRDEVVRSIKTALDDAGIQIPFPQRTLWFADNPEKTSIDNKSP